MASMAAACAVAIGISVFSTGAAAQSETSSSASAGKKAGATAAISKKKSASLEHSSAAKSSPRKSHAASAAKRSGSGATIASRGGAKRGSARRSGKRRTVARGQQKIDPERAQAIQEALIREHYLSGAPAGTWNESSEAAMRRYQADHGWQSKTVPDARALISLGLGPSHDHLLNPDSAMTTGPETPSATSLTPVSHSVDPVAHWNADPSSVEAAPGQSSGQNPAGPR